jgi:hypothetical protein
MLYWRVSPRRRHPDERFRRATAMAEDEKPQPAISEAGRAKAAAREARRAAALRENLRRRKAQQRARIAPAAPPDEAEDEGR